jgi:hypothetical protein
MLKTLIKQEDKMKTALYNFNNSPDAGNPYGSLLNIGSVLYGTTISGGAV